MSKIYIAGPMTGLSEFNYPAFNAAADELRAQGHQVENPAENPDPACKSWAGYMRMALAQLVLCDVIYLLRGWECSRGAKLEYGLAVALGMHVQFQSGGWCGVDWAETPAAPADPMDWPLPCDVTVGHVTMGKGVKLSTLVLRMKVLYRMATGNDADEVAARTPEQRAQRLAAFQAQIGATPAAPAEHTPAQKEVLAKLLELARIVDRAVEDWGESHADGSSHVIFHKAEADARDAILDYFDGLPENPDPQILDSGPIKAARVLFAALAAPAPAWADQAVIEYQYTGGTQWCPLGPAERMKADFDGVYRLQPGTFPALAAPADALDALDAARLDFIERSRVALVPEFEGPWEALVYKDDAEPVVTGEGNTPRAAIDAAIAAQAAQKEGA